MQHVIIGGINRQEGQDAIHKLNGKFGKDRAHFMDCDVTNECDFDNLFTETRRIFGYPDILFNNAGMLEDKKWSQTVDVNIKGVLLGCFLAFKYMGKDQEGGKGGVVVNNASILGFDACAGCPVYNCTKHAVIGITKALGAEFHYKRTCIRVCSICPGVTNTELVTGAKGRQYMGEWGEETARQLSQLPQQEIGATGQAFMYIVRHGISAEHYIIEGSEVFHAKPPPRQTFSTLKRSFKKD
ncbi:hypothetical protein R5R35_005760 [Gryllus longicercus]|nr:Alcohol dehydrogenase 1 [Gryllus bimaculatus]